MRYVLLYIYFFVFFVSYNYTFVKIIIAFLLRFFLQLGKKNKQKVVDNISSFNADIFLLYLEQFVLIVPIKFFYMYLTRRLYSFNLVADVINRGQQCLDHVAAIQYQQHQFQRSLLMLMLTRCQWPIYEFIICALLH